MPVYQTPAQIAHAEKIAKNRIKFGKYVKRVNLSQLSDGQRRRIWEGIKKKTQHSQTC